VRAARGAQRSRDPDASRWDFGTDAGENILD
jgi:hypothetical protein